MNSVSVLGYSIPQNASMGTPAVSSSGCIVPTDLMFIYEDTTFCEGTYNLPNGIVIGTKNIILDCNNSVLDGSSGTYPYRHGIQIQDKSGVTIRNCKIQNYDKGIYLYYANHNHLIKNILTNHRAGIWLSLSDNNILVGNNASNNQFGIIISASDYNNLVENIFSNNIHGSHPTGLWFQSMSYWHYEFNEPIDNKIYNNDFYDTGIDGSYGSNYELYNTFCVNGIGNTYLDGATGPTCEDLPSYSWISKIKDAVCYLFNHLTISNPYWECPGEIITTTTTTLTTTTSDCCGLLETTFPDMVTCPIECSGIIENCRVDMYRNDKFMSSYYLNPGEGKKVNAAAGYSLKLYGICE